MCYCSIRYRRRRIRTGYYENLRKAYTCCDCPKAYKHYSSLWKHRNYECGKEATFSCGLNGCTYVAKRKDHLRTHMKSHKRLRI
ncbi:hypothetical protein Trydic_g17156 [Trypoxylus dichotomus]